ncbi:MAG: aminopeptidase N [Thiotrichales bacterium]|jgi:aminopeptidase N|nr:aminopeptidase N [Thiotrichales bacterium]
MKEIETTYLKNYRAPTYLIPEVMIFFNIAKDATQVKASLTVVRDSAPQSDAKEQAVPFILNGGDQELVSLSIDGVRLQEDSYCRDKAGIAIFNPPAEFTLQMETKLYPAKNTELEGLYQSGPIFCTQCEAEGFRKIIFFPDRPDIMAKFTVTIAADPKLCPVLLSNGNPTKQGGYPDGRHWVIWEDPFPKPAYLFALVAGELSVIQDQFTTASGRDVTLQIYTEKHNIDKCSHAMESLKRAMLWDEEVYGREYDLDLFNIVVVDDFNMGAMENKGLNIFNSKFILAKPETATDSDYINIEAVVGHEYFHNWTGNRITCRDWFQLSLKEGLTVFRDQEFTADHNARAVKRIQDVRMLRSAQFAEDGGAMSHPVRPEQYVEISNFYTVTIYEKGAEVVRMQHTLLGAELYREGMDLYFKRHDGEAVTVEDFVSCMEEVSGRDMGQFMSWYKQRGTPELNAQWSYNRQDGTLNLTLEQTPPSALNSEEKANWQPHHIPVMVGLLSQSGGDDILIGGDKSKSQLLELTDSKQEFILKVSDISEVDGGVIPSILRGFSAPLLLTTAHSVEERLFIMAHDSDSFNRWEAGQQVAEDMLLSGKVSEEWLSAIGKVIESALYDPALATEMLTLPSEKWLAEKMKVVDVEAIHAIREQAISALVERYREQLLSIYQQPVNIAAERTLHNHILLILMRLEQPEEIVKLALAQFNSAENMSDEIAALAALEKVESVERENVLAQFYKKWRAERLVIDKWFALQAGSQLPATVKRVKDLLEHTDFAISNPNRVRSLVGVFTQANPLHFHTADGEGYRFLADQVLRLDPLNPQVAARMVGGFNQWKRYDESRQHLMREQLERIIVTNGISKDVSEIVNRALSY